MTQKTEAGPRGIHVPYTLWSLVSAPLSTMTRLAHEHGDVVEVPLTRRHRFFMLSHPRHVEHILVANERNYVKAFTYRGLGEIVGSGLLLTEGEEWSAHRAVVQPMFARRRLDCFVPFMVDAAKHTLARLDRLPDGAIVDVAALMSELAVDLLGRSLFGTPLKTEARRVASAVATLQAATVGLMRNPIAWFSPRLGMRLSPGHRRTADALSTLHQVVDAVVERARRRSGNDENNMVSALLAASGPGGPYTRRQVHDEVMAFLLAGHETPANSLTWTLYLLSAYPAARERLERELGAVVGDDALTADASHRLEWTQAVLTEAMRLYPPEWSMERRALRSDAIKDLVIPAGSTVALPPYLVHRNPAVWDDPCGFAPERFLPGQAVHPKYAYIPFGAGRRICVAAGFSMLEATVVLALLGRHYRFELLPHRPPAPEASVTLRPRGGLPMVLRRRSPAGDA